MITFGTNPGMGIPITARDSRSGEHGRSDRARIARQGAAVHGSEAGKPLVGHPINVVFIGSCTNSRMSDLRAAASVLKGRKVSPKVRVMVVPGSQEIKRQAEAEGSTEIFRDAGAEWREAGCSMCIAMNGDQLAARRVQRLDQQSQLRRPAGQGRPHVPGEPADRRRQRHHRHSHRRADIAANECEVHYVSKAACCRCRSTTSTPTRSSRRAS